MSLNFLKISRAIFLAAIHRGYKFYMAGIIPGGGLGKLQGIKEEEYFFRQDYKLFENMKEKSENFKWNDLKCFDYGQTINKTPILRSCESTYSVKHKNLLEEAYFLNDHCDCLKLLKAKFNHEDEQNNSLVYAKS